jgi:hypothetical protein
MGSGPDFFVGKPASPVFLMNLLNKETFIINWIFVGKPVSPVLRFLGVRGYPPIYIEIETKK